jgi:hypothetical protein
MLHEDKEGQISLEDLAVFNLVCKHICDYVMGPVDSDESWVNLDRLTKRAMETTGAIDAYRADIGLLDIGDKELREHLQSVILQMVQKTGVYNNNHLSATGIRIQENKDEMRFAATTAESKAVIDRTREFLRGAGVYQFTRSRAAAAAAAAAGPAAGTRKKGKAAAAAAAAAVASNAALAAAMFEGNAGAAAASMGATARGKRRR